MAPGIFDMHACTYRYMYVHIHVQIHTNNIQVCILRRTLFEQGVVKEPAHAVADFSCFELSSLADGRVLARFCDVRRQRSTQGKGHDTPNVSHLVRVVAGHSRDFSDPVWDPEQGNNPSSCYHFLTP